jgi:DNA-binding phage protein
MASPRKRNAADTSIHERWLEGQMQDPEFRTEFERARREIDVIDAIVNALDGLRAEHGMSKAQLAREIGKNPASIRRLLTAPANPELRTVVAIADALDADIMVVPRETARGRKRRKSGAAT